MDEVDKLKNDLLKLHRTYIQDLEADEGIIVQQRAMIGEYQRRMDEFFERRTAAVLALLATLIRQSVQLSVDNFKEDGATYDDVKYIEEALGISNGRIQKTRNNRMTVLFAIGSLKVIENDVITLVNSSFTGMVKRKELYNAIERSVNRKFYDFFTTYAVGAVFQSYNTAQLSFARKYNYQKFLYAGDIIEESRDFCVERAGLEFDREEGDKWNEMEWRGKIPGVDFFIQVGGYNCRHHIEWTKDEKNN